MKNLRELASLSWWPRKSRPGDVFADPNANRDRGQLAIVLIDTFYPTGRDELAGQPQEICCANDLFRALSVPPSQHDVIYIYDRQL
jgi:hypothetical protein